MENARPVEEWFQSGVVEKQLAVERIILSVLSAAQENPNEAYSRPLYGIGLAGYWWLDFWLVRFLLFSCLVVTNTKHLFTVLNFQVMITFHLNFAVDDSSE